MKPHVILILADQLRRDFIGELTPSINSLASESTVFHRAYTPCPLCVPARGSLFTGLYPNTSGSLINPWEKTDRRFGLVRAGTPHLYGLMDKDWDSWMVGKQHFYTEDGLDQSGDSLTRWITMKGYFELLDREGKRRPGGPDFRGLVPEMAGGTTTRPVIYSMPGIGCYEAGFDYFYDGYITNAAIEAIHKRNREKPFLLNLMFFAPHPPYDIPEPWFSRVKKVELSENVGRWYPGQSPLQLYNYPGVAGARYNRGDWEKIWPVYGGLVSLLDDCIGMVISTLKREGLYDDAVILFSSDHGEMLGSHCLYQKMCMYEEATHIPLMVKLPRGMKQARECEEIVSLIDILPTLCDLLELEKPSGNQGMSLLPCLRESEIPGAAKIEGRTLPRDRVFLQFDGNGARGNFQRAVVRNRNKLIVDLFKNEIFFELYDVISDPQEKHNLAYNEPDKVKELFGLLRRHMVETSDMIRFRPEDYERFRKSTEPYRDGMRGFTKTDWC